MGCPRHLLDCPFVATADAYVNCHCIPLPPTQPPPRCRLCKQYMDDPNLKIYPGDPDNAVSGLPENFVLMFSHLCDMHAEAVLSDDIRTSSACTYLYVVWVCTSFFLVWGPVQCTVCVIYATNFHVWGPTVCVIHTSTFLL